jgi:hypothetical protein
MQLLPAGLSQAACVLQQLLLPLAAQHLLQQGLCQQFHQPLQPLQFCCKHMRLVCAEVLHALLQGIRVTPQL